LKRTPQQAADDALAGSVQTISRWFRPKNPGSSNNGILDENTGGLQPDVSL